MGQKMDIVLQTHDKQKVLTLNNFQLSESFGQAELYVFSGGFSVDTLFYFDRSYFKAFVKNLKVIRDTLCGEAILKPKYEDDYIKFSGSKSGHVVVEGEIFWHSEFDQKLRFSFQTDQTVLAPFIADLAKAAGVNF